MRVRPLMVGTLALAACGSKAGPGTEDSGVSSTYAASWSGMDQMFTDHCDSCHPATTGVDLRSVIEADLASGAGAYVVPGEPDASLLWQSVGGTSLNAMMPPSGRLDDNLVQPVATWIAAGAPLE